MFRFSKKINLFAIAFLLFVSNYPSITSAATTHDCQQLGGTEVCTENNPGATGWRYGICDETAANGFRIATWCRAFDGTWNGTNASVPCSGREPLVSDGQIIPASTAFETSIHSACEINTPSLNWGRITDSFQCWNVEVKFINDVEVSSGAKLSFNGNRINDGQCNRAWSEVVYARRDRDLVCPTGFTRHSLIIDATHIEIKCLKLGGAYSLSASEFSESCDEGNPCNPSTGNKTQKENDYTSGHGSTLSIDRIYNSKGALRSGWHHNYSSSLDLERTSREALPSDDISSEYNTRENACIDGFDEIRNTVWSGMLSNATATYMGDNLCKITQSDQIIWFNILNRSILPLVPTSTRSTHIISRPSGKDYVFTQDATSQWVSISNPEVSLNLSGDVWIFTDADNNKESYNSLGQLISIVRKDGKTTVLTYTLSASENGDGNPDTLDKVTDASGRHLLFHYDSDTSAPLLSHITTPDGVVVYEYTNDNLTQVFYPDNSSKTYQYENNSFPHHLTGITDENGKRFATWNYDNNGKTISSEHANAVEKITLAYNNDGTTTVIGALGDVRTYHFSIENGERRVSNLEGDQCRTCGNGFMKSRSYDVNGFLNGYIDWKGNQTTITNNDRGLPLQRTEAVGTSQERTTTTVWHSTLNLPTHITEPKRKTDFSYTTSGQLLTQTITDLTNNETRTTTYTYHLTGTNGEGLIATIDNSREDVNDITRYDYDAQDNLITITNALDQTTHITSHDPSGRPLIIIDENNVTTTLIWDLRGRLLSVTTAGNTTSFNYDHVGQLVKITQADNSYLSYSYDDAHRLIAISDNANNKIEYVLDKMGNRISTTIAGTTGNISYSRSGIFDKLSRLKESLGAHSQHQLLNYDLNHNPLNSTDALNRLNQNNYDALDRLIKHIDPENKETRFEYDSQDNLSKVTDAKNLESTYTYNGFDEIISQTSPDTGITTYTYDKTGNRTRMTDARGVTVQYSYDALNRLTNVDYSDTTLSITHRYDSGTNGIGRLSQTHDASGTTDYTYDERGNLLSQTLVNSSGSYTTEYTYDAADRISSMTYPSGHFLQYQRAANGEITQITATIDSTTQALITNASYLPFGSVTSFTYGNTLNYQASFDNSRRLINQSTTGIQGSDYEYNTVNNLITFNNILNNSLNQQFDYDALDRLTTANGNYGTFGYVFDVIGNRLKKTEGATNQNYTYADTSHQLQSLTDAEINTTTYQYDAVGNSTDNGIYQFIYGDNNRLQQVMQGTTEIARYIYNAQGQRTRKLVNGMTTHFFYDQSGHLILEKSPTTTRETIFFDGQPIAFYHASSETGNTAEVILDNPDASFTDNWALSTSVSGYQGSNYQYHAGAEGIGPGMLGNPLDNTQATFTDNWPSSTSVKHYLGNNYQYHAGTSASVGQLGNPVDNLQATYTGTWPLSTSVKQFFDSNYQYHSAGSGANTATWDAGITTVGAYDIYINWAAHPNRASNAKFTIHHSTGTDTQTVNQKINGGQWNLLGNYTLDANSHIILSDDADGYVIADAISILPAGTPPNVTQPKGETASWNLNVANTSTTQDYDVYATWTAHANRASNANYTIYHSNGSDTVTVNQKQNGGQWNLLGTYSLDTNSSVELSSHANGYVIADAITILPAGTSPSPTPAQGETASWSPNQSGEFEIYAKWTQHANRASNANYTLQHSQGNDTVTVNQKQNGGQWNLLGTFTLDANSKIELSSIADGYVIADGIRLISTAPQVTTGFYYVHNNHLGTPEVITDQDQSPVWQASYTPYGKATVTTESLTNNVRLPGQYFDAETGLHYNYYRYYDPLIGRYVTSDPIGLRGGVNTYSYVRGNPTKYTDRLGLDLDLIINIDPTLYYELRADEFGFDPFTKEGAYATAKAVQLEAFYEIAGLGLGAGIGKVSGKVCSATKGVDPLKEALSKAKPTKNHPNQVMHELDDGTRVMFRKDFGEQAHNLGGRFQGKGKIDHYNVQIQNAKGKTIENLHIVPDGKGGVVQFGKDGVVK